MYELLFALILLFINLLLIVVRTVPILNVVVSLFTLGIAATIIGNVDIPYQPLFSTFLIVLAIINMTMAIKETRN